VGAFALSSGSKDAAVLATLNPGTYSVLISGVGGTSGTVLYELYDADGARMSTFSYLAYEAPVGAGDAAMIAGFISSGSQGQDVLVRALGPSLSTGGLADPRLELVNSAGSVAASNNDWAGDPAITAATTLVGAAQLEATSKESALLKTVAPGSYTALVTGANSTTGRTRLEIYALPAREFHSADVNRDGRVSLLELTRVIELYNVRNGTTRTGGYSVATTSTEDGFSGASERTNAETATLARYHSADTNRDGRIALLELTRVIELYNQRSGTTRTGQYKPQAGTEDGFSPGN